MSVNIVKTINGEKTLQKVAGLIPPAFSSLGDCLEINADHELDVADNSITYEKIDNEIKNKITNVANSNDIYNESKNYVKGDIVIDTDYKLYELTANSYMGAIHPKDSDSWEEMSLASYSNSLKSSLAKFSNNKMSSTIALTSYTSSSNPYTFLTDGYLRVNAPQTDNTKATGVLLDGNGENPITINVVGNANIVATNYLFVRKGMKAYYSASTSSSGGGMTFFPFTM